MVLNWIDWIIVAVIVYYFWQGWEQGVIYLAGSLISFLGALWLAVKFHAPVGSFLVDKFGIPAVWTTVLGYLIVGFVAEIVIAEIINLFMTRLSQKIIASKINQWLGAGLSSLNSLVIISFALLVILALPLRGTIKKDIGNSVFGKRLVIYAEKYGGQVKSALDQVAHEAVRFITVTPRSTERINLDVKLSVSQLVVDIVAEKRMLELVNQERIKAGVGSLSWDLKMTEVARAHSHDMFVRGYFSHINPEGASGGDRLEAAGISFIVAAENLAYAPDVETAHRGLMESEGHRKNILDPGFRRLGVGAIDSGIYGEMLTQEFAD